MNNTVLILTVVIILIFSNWLTGFITFNFFSQKYQPKESLDFLKSNKMKLIKLIRPTEKFQIKSDVLLDNRSLLKKIYSKRSLHILIVETENDLKQRVLWVELLQFWNFMPLEIRKLNHYKETNIEVIKTLT